MKKAPVLRLNILDSVLTISRHSLRNHEKYVDGFKDHNNETRYVAMIAVRCCIQIWLSNILSSTKCASYSICISNNVCTRVANCLCDHKRGILVFIINKYQNNTRVGAKTVRHESTDIIFFLTRHYESINDDKTTIFTHRLRLSLARCSFCWLCHNALQWRHNEQTIVTRAREKWYLTR